MRCFALLVCFLGFGTVPVSGADLTGTVAVAGRPAPYNLAFIPHVLAVRVGTTVDFPMDR